MAVTLSSVTTDSIEARPHSSGWHVQAYSADASGCEAIVAAPSAGTALYIENLTIFCQAALKITVGAGETDGAVTTTLWGPFEFSGATWPVLLQLGPFIRPVKLTDATALTFDADAAGEVIIIAEGYTR